MTALAHSIADLRDRLASRRSGTVGLVPTMGALHAGHVRLIEAARAECKTVVVSIFVNPLQFDRQDDLQQYPRMLQADLELCSGKGVDLVFAPPEAEMYPVPPGCSVDVVRIGDHLCGRFRPGHFRGVATVVLKLLNIVQPDRAYFGEKDAQQLAIIRRLVSDLNVPVTIVGVPTVREADGLAVSSRNQRLSEAERKLSARLYGILSGVREQIAGGSKDVETIKRAVIVSLPEDVRLEYLEIVDDEMQPVAQSEGPVRVAAALWVGETRLIDNLLCTPPRRPV